MLRLAKENNLGSLEKPKDFFVSSEPFTPESDTLTATMKLKRHNAARAYQAQIDVMYEKITAAEHARDQANNM